MSFRGSAVGVRVGGVWQEARVHAKNTTIVWVWIYYEAVTRLRCEFVVPRTTTVVVTHEVSFRAYVIGNNTIGGKATNKLHFEHAPLLFVIRNVEKN